MAMLRIKNKIKAIIFDMDGTIIKSNSQWRQATHMAMIRRNVCPKKLEKTLHPLHEKAKGIGIIKMAKMIKQQLALPDCPIKISEDIKKIAQTEFERKIEFIEGFHDFHTELREHGIKSCIATNADKDSFAVIRKKTNFDTIFGQHLYCMDDVAQKVKPDPAIFLHAAEKMGVPIEECVVFEDSYVGFSAAKSAGARCIAIKSEKNQEFLHLVHGAVENYLSAKNALLELLGVK